MGFDCAFDLQVFLLPDKAAYLMASPVRNVIGGWPVELRIRFNSAQGSCTTGGQ
jgi:hypothetical protein